MIFRRNHPFVQIKYAQSQNEINLCLPYVSFCTKRAMVNLIFLSWQTVKFQNIITENTLAMIINAILWKRRKGVKKWISKSISFSVSLFSADKYLIQRLWFSVDFVYWLHWKYHIISSEDLCYSVDPSCLKIRWS